MKIFFKILVFAVVSAVSTVASASGDNRQPCCNSCVKEEVFYCDKCKPCCNSCVKEEVFYCDKCKPARNCCAKEEAVCYGKCNPCCNSSAKAGFVVGADCGYGYLNSPEGLYPSDFSIQEDSTVVKFDGDNEIGHVVWGAHVGYDFKILSHFLFGCELGYKDFGKSKLGGSVYVHTKNGGDFNVDFLRKYKQTAIDFLLTGHLFPLANGLNFFGKIGAAYVRSHVEQNFDTNVVISTNNSDVSLGFFLNQPLNGKYTIWRLVSEFAFGVGYTFECHVDIHAMYTYTSSSCVNFLLEKAKVYDTNTLMGGISFIF